MRAKLRKNPAPDRDSRPLQQILAGLGEGIVLIDPHGRVVWANDTALAIHGVAEVAQLGLAASDYRTRFRLQVGESMPRQEAALSLPGGISKIVLIAGQAIEIGGEACLLLSFLDPEPRSAIERTLRQSEERFSIAFQLAPVPMALISRAQFQLLDINDAFAATTGYARSELLASAATTLLPWAEPEAFASMRSVLEEAGHLHDFEIGVRTRLGARIDCVASAETVVFEGEACILCVLQDITERKRSEVELIAAIEAVMEDASWFSRRVIEKLAQLRQAHGPLENTADLADLTPRERVILGLMSQGNSDANIATALQLSRHTVRNHAAAIYAKIGVHRRSAAIVWARERGVVK